MTELEFVRELVVRAGDVALSHTREMQTELKADSSYVTNIDRGVEDLVRAEIELRYPKDAIYGEERGGDPRAAERVWIIDPIDGTTNLVFGLPVWGVSVGLVEAGQPKAGAFHMPRLDETYWFEAGAGAYFNGAPVSVTGVSALHVQDVIGIGSEAVVSLDLSRFECRQRGFGSTCAHYAYTARGAFRAHVSRLDRLHDLGAVFGLALEAGCVVEWLSGGEAPLQHWLDHRLNEEAVLVGPPATLPELRERLLFRG